MKLIDENSPHPELEPMDMHGPVEVDVRVYIKKPDGIIGRMTFTHPVGQLPTRAELAGYMEAAQQEAQKVGAELPSKPEFVAHLTQRETGKAIPMAGARHWVQASSEIPRGVLVHAIVGTGVPGMDRWDDFFGRGLAYLNLTNGFMWRKEALEAMTDYELESLYREVSNG